MSNLRISTYKLEIERGHTKPNPKAADERHCMVCRTGDIEDEINFLCHCEGYKDLWSNFIQYLEMNEHGTNLEDSESIRDLFRTKKMNILNSFGKFIADCYRIREPSRTEIWNAGGLYVCFCVSCEWELEMLSTLAIRMFHVVVQEIIVLLLPDLTVFSGKGWSQDSTIYLFLSLPSSDKLRVK